MINWRDRLQTGWLVGQFINQSSWHLHSLSAFLSNAFSIGPEELITGEWNYTAIGSEFQADSAQAGHVNHYVGIALARLGWITG